MYKKLISVGLTIALIICTVLNTAIVSASSTQNNESKNLVINSSFESTDGWAFGSIYRSNDKAHSGNYSAKCSARGNSVCVANSQIISVSQNTDYLFSAYVFRQDNSAWAYVDMNDRTAELQLLDTTASGKWQYVSGVWNSGTSTSVQLRMVVEPNYTINQHMKEGITGDCWFDDISLTALNYDSYDEQPAVIGEQKSEFVLDNSDITASIVSSQNKEYITQLINKKNGYNWINTACESALPQPLGDNKVDWKLQSCTFDNQKPLVGVGKNACHTLSFTYTSQSPKLTLNTYWKIYPTGPLYHYSEIQNNTGNSIRFDSNNITSGDVLFKVPSNSQVYRFNRSRYNNGFDGLFSTGVLRDNVENNMFLKTSVENSRYLDSGLLPFEILQSENHGLYIGYEWSYGQMLMRTQSNKNIMRFSADFGYSTDSITRENGEKLLVPPVFFGAYDGGVDDGSNNMKKWFYNHLMTESLRENSNEPLVEFHLPLYSENDLNNYLNNNNLEQYGVELTKMDYWWTVPSDKFDDYLETQWNPDKGKWPNGMTYGKIVKQKFPSIKTSLYMCDTYQGVDIGTKEGRQRQIDALTTRMNDWQIDYWRSDFDLLKPNNYANHEGLMYILDTMIANNKNFRYEHCSAGGSLKDFATLQRMTFMTMEDSGGALNHRKAFYSNSYMINPIQLKFDLGFDWTSNEDSGYIASNQEKWTTYNVRTAMLGAMMVQNVSSNLTDIQKRELIKGWNLYKTRQREILRGANVYHILPMPDGKNWDGIEYYNDELQKGSVFLFRDKNINATDSSSKNIKLSGLDSNAKYSLEFEDRKGQNKVLSGKQLMENGFTVTNMNSVYDSEIIWVTKVDDSTPTDPVPTVAPTTQSQTQIPTFNPNEITVQFRDTQGWDTAYVHYWGDSSTNWPGVQMNKVGDNLYQFSLPKGVVGVVFNNGNNGQQTVDIVPSNAVGYSPSSFENGKWNCSAWSITLPPQPTTVVPTVPTTQPTTDPPQPDVMIGDVNGDGIISIVDATYILKYLASLEDFKNIDKKIADVNFDNEVNVNDVTTIQKILVGLVDNPNEDTRTLKQLGNKVVNGKGEEVQLLGVNIPQFGWTLDGDGVGADGKSDADRLLDIALDDWNSNIIRLAVTPDYWLNGGTRFGKFTSAEQYRNNVDKIIKRIGDSGNYVLLDCHTYYSPSDNEVEFWKSAAVHYKDNPTVIFGVMNEPVSDWNVYFNGGNVTVDNKSYVSKGVPNLVKTIRNTGAKNMISVGGIDFAYDVSQILRDDILKNAEVGGNGMFIEIHPYSNKPNVFNSYWQTVDNVASKYPIMIGECGPTYRGSSQSTGLQDPLTNDELRYLDMITQKIDSNGYHMTAWGMGAWPFLYQTDKGITAFGEYIKNYLTSKQKTRQGFFLALF